MKKTIFIAILFLLPLSVFAQTGNKTIDGIFKTANDVLITVQKTGDYIDQAQRSFGELRIINMTDAVAEFTPVSSSFLDSYDSKVLEKPGQRESYNVTLIPSSTNTVQISVFVTAWRIIDGKKVYAVSGQSVDVWFNRGSDQRIKTIILRSNNENYWLEVR